MAASRTAPSRLPLALLPLALLFPPSLACATAPAKALPPMTSTQPPAPAGLPPQDLAFLQSLAQTRSFTLGRPGSVQLTPDGRTALFLRALPRKAELRLFAFDLTTAQTRELVAPESVLGAGDEQLSADEKARRERMRISARGIVAYELSKDGALVLFSLGGRAWVVPVKPGEGPAKAREAAGPGPKGEAIFDPHLSPDASMISFVRGGELWVAPLAGGAPRQLTSGATATLLHARAEYVAQEELSRFAGYWWSPDSKQLVYEEVDNAGVEQLWLQDPARMFGAPVTPMAYPRPGKANAKIRFGIISATGGATTWIAHQPAAFEYVSRVTWQEGGPLSLLVLSRDQRTLALLAVEPDGQTRTLLTETDEIFLNSERDLRWLSSGRGFLWSTETSGAWTLEHRDSSGRLVRVLTAPAFGHLRVVGLDEAGAGSAFTTASPTPLSQELWELPLDGAAPRKLHTGPEHATAVFSKGSRAHVLTLSPQHGVTRLLAVRADGTVAGELPSIAEAPPLSPKLSLAQVGAAPGGLGGFWTALVRPRDFDAAKRYPVLVRVYGGPHHNEVTDVAGAYVVDQWIADHGFLVVHIDPRGTQLRGRAWERAVFGKFSEVPLDDTVAGLQALAAQEPALDLSRVGIIGHSFGGYLAALAVLRRPDVFRAAVAGAPVVDWANYDTAYAERYLGVPPPAGASSVYAQNGLLAYAKELSRPLLLEHGTADDNVHFSETLLLTDALFRAGKRFELIPYSAQTHQISARPELAARHWERVFAFFRENL